MTGGKLIPNYIWRYPRCKSNRAKRGRTFTVGCLELSRIYPALGDMKKKIRSCLTPNAILRFFRIVSSVAFFSQFIRQISFIWRIHSRSPPLLTNYSRVFVSFLLRRSISWKENLVYMDTRYRHNHGGSEIAKTKETPKSSPEAAPNSEKRHAALAKIPPHEWLKEQVLDWAEESDASLALTCPNDK